MAVLTRVDESPIPSGSWMRARLRQVRVGVSEARRPDDPPYVVPTWDPAKAEHVTAVVACPTCDALFTLQNHTIADDGTVRPSVVCPRRCGYHEFVRLEGWTP